MTSVPVLESARLVLRPLVVDDAAALHPLYADDAAMRYWSHAAHTSLRQTQDKLAKILGTEGARLWAITRPGDDMAIGTVNARTERPRVFEIGYALARAHWGGGVASEAVARMLDHLFDAERPRRVFADTDPDNAASNALLTRLGFQREGLLRALWETHIGVRDTVIWGLLPDEWARCRPT